MDYDHLLELVKKRRSIRRFKPDPIPEDTIHQIIEVARWAPSGFNMQPWEFVMVRNPELKEEIVKLVNDYRRTYYPRMEETRESWQKISMRLEQKGPLDWSQAPVFIVLFGDTRVQKGLPMAVRYDARKCQSIFTSSLAGAFIYMHLAAASLGLASQWVSAVQVPIVHCLLKNLLGIPEFLEIYDMMAVGYPAAKPRPKFMRPLESVIHFDHCTQEDFRTDAKTWDFIKRTRAWAIAAIRRGADKDLA